MMNANKLSEKGKSIVWFENNVCLGCSKWNRDHSYPIVIPGSHVKPNLEALTKDTWIALSVNIFHENEDYKIWRVDIKKTIEESE